MKIKIYFVNSDYCLEVFECQLFGQWRDAIESYYSSQWFPTGCLLGGVPFMILRGVAS